MGTWAMHLWTLHREGLSEDRIFDNYKMTWFLWRLNLIHFDTLRLEFYHDHKCPHMHITSKGRLSYAIQVLAFAKRKIKRLRWYVKSSTFPSSLNENEQLARFLIKSKILHHENDRNNPTFSWGLLCNVIILRKTLVKILKICSFRLDRHCFIFQLMRFC